MHKITKLKNGLTILKVPISGSKSVLLDVFVKTGSRQETPRINGISHFLEHIFFKGSSLYPTAQDLSHALDAIGAEYNANTGKEHTQYYIKAARHRMEFIFTLLSDMLHRPIFNKAEVEREKGVIIEEINMYEDTPIRHVEDIFEELMWPNQPLGRNIAGTKEVIRKIQRSDIVNYVQTFYQPSNMILGIAGSFNEKLFDKLVAEHWAKIKGKSIPTWQKAKSFQKAPEFALSDKKTEQYHLALGFRSYDYNHPNYIPQIVLATILGGGMSSRLFTEVRERRGLAYYVRAGTTNYQDTGNFVIQAGVRQDAVREALRVILAELHRIKKEPIENKELDKAKEYLKGTLTLSLEASENLLGWYLEQVAFKKKVIEPEQTFTLLNKVTSGDIHRVANDIFQNSAMNLAVIGGKKAEKELEKLLQM